MCCQDKSCSFVNISFYCQHGSFSSTLTGFISCFTSKQDLPKSIYFLKCSFSWCACSSMTLHPHHAWFCVCMCGCQSGLAVQRTSERLHSACLRLTWLSKTAVGFAPRGREDCALSVKNIPGVPTSVIRRLWIKPSCGPLPIVRGREGHEKEPHTTGMHPDWWWRRPITILSFSTCWIFARNYWWKLRLLITARLRGMVFNNAWIFSTLHLRHKEWTGRDPN